MTSDPADDADDPADDPAKDPADDAEDRADDADDSVPDRPGVAELLAAGVDTELHIFEAMPVI